MKYVLVLQWPGSSMEDYNSMIGVEELLTSSLPRGSIVDGHDVGSGETNIFIETDDPQRSFEAVKSVLGSRDTWSTVRIAYRGSKGDKYTILWPNNLRDFEVR